MFVLDTNVVSELRKAHDGKADPRVVDWASAVRPTALFLSVVTLMELEQGTLSLERRDARQGAAIRRWLERQVQPAFEGRVLPIDERVALRCARLHVPDPRQERDALIAATALTHGMTVVTRDTADFAPHRRPAAQSLAAARLRIDACRLRPSQRHATPCFARPAPPSPSTPAVAASSTSRARSRAGSAKPA